MKRPLLLFTVSLSIGIVLSYFLNSYLLSFLSIILFCIIMSCVKRRYNLRRYLVIGIMLFYSIGSIEYLFVVNNTEKRFIDFKEREVTIRGYIVDEPQIKEQKVNYLLRAREIEINNSTKPVKGKILLSTLMNEQGKFYQYGQELEIRGKISIPQQERNPGGFDYRRYLAGSGISATIFARDYNIKILQGNQINHIVKTGLILRKRIIYVINNSLPKGQAGLLNGMLIGYRDGLSKNVQNAFSDAGLSHIMAVSGANVAFIVFPLVFLFKKLRMRKGLANIIIILILVLFVCVTGFSPSVVRAVIMGIIILLAQIIKRDSDVYTNIALAAMILLIYNPYVLFDIGFQLSYGATISLVLFYKLIKEKLSLKHVPVFLTDLIAVTTAAQIGVLPLTAYYFNKISIISLFSNIFAVPLTGFITILGFIMAILGQFSLFLSELVGLVNNTLLTFILFVTKISAELPFAVLKVITPHVFVVILYYLFVMFIFWYKPKYKPEIRVKPIYYVVFICCFIFLFNIYRLVPGRLEVAFVDVGQGDCAFIKSSTGKTVLIDGGGSAAKGDNDSNIGETTVIPFLYDYGVSKVDVVIATHGHADHIQGLIPVLKEMGVEKLIVPDSHKDIELEKIINLAKSRNIPVYKCVKGDMIKLDSNTFLKVIHPSKGFEIDKSYSNNSSLVLKLLYKNISMLFTGDIEKDTEDILVQDKLDLKADILKVAHHGSPYSTTEDFLEAVDPKAAVISVGKNNFGHPDDAVLGSMGEKRIKLYRTDKFGAILLKSNGKRITIKKTIGE